ncbi:MAG: undecaprenyl diphosphate synthase, partial [Ilumatobacteraceae bacterium]
GWLTVFGFSTENWVRPRGEVRHILGLHKKLFGRIAELNDLNVRVQWIGRPFDSPEARTPRYIQKAIQKAIADTAGNTGMVLTVAFDYGSRAEIVHAAEAAIGSTSSRVSAADLGANMYLPELPAVDVVVRPSGERRISNFMLWQSAGTPVYFTEQTWPDFGPAELDAAIAIARR